MITVLFGFLIISLLGGFVIHRAIYPPTAKSRKAKTARRAARAARRGSTPKPSASGRRSARTGDKTTSSTAPKTSGRGSKTRSTRKRHTTSASPAAAVGGLLASLLAMLFKAARDAMSKDVRATKAAEAHAKAKEKGRTASTRSGDVIAEHRPWSAVMDDLKEAWESFKGNQPTPAESTPGDDTAAPQDARPVETEPVPTPSENTNRKESTEGDSTVSESTGNLSNAVPASFTAHLSYVSDFEPESDGHLLAFMAGESAAMCAYADALTNLYDTCIGTVGLDPSAMQGMTEYADAATEAAQAMVKAHAQFMEVYRAVMEMVANGTVLPYNGRFMTGEHAA